MPMHRKNRSKPRHESHEQKWFTNNVKRQRRREEIASESRRRNRK